MSSANYTGIPDSPCNPVELAKLIGCNAETVRLHIEAGDLEAINIGRPGSTRPTWRITPEAVVKMYERLGARKSTKKTERRRSRNWEAELDELLAD